MIQKTMTLQCGHFFFGILKSLRNIFKTLLGLTVDGVKKEKYIKYIRPVVKKQF